MTTTQPLFSNSSSRRGILRKERGIIIEHIACYIMCISENCKKTDHISKISHIDNPFRLIYIPNITLVNYLKRISRYAYGISKQGTIHLVSAQTLVYAVLHINEIRYHNVDSDSKYEQYSNEISNYTLYKMLLVTVMYYAKLCDGLDISADIMGQIGGTTVDINKLLIHFKNVYCKFKLLTSIDYVNFYKIIGNPSFHKLCSHDKLPQLSYVKKISINIGRKYTYKRNKTLKPVLSPIREQ